MHALTFSVKLVDYIFTIVSVLIEEKKNAHKKLKIEFEMLL